MEPVGRRLRVLQLNLNVDRPSGAVGDALVRQMLRELRPDIVCLQEALWHDGCHQGLALLEGCGFASVVHQFNVQRHVDRYYGTVIASRWPISHSDVVKLPSTARGAAFPRSLQAAEVDCPPPVGRLLVVNAKPHYEPHMELEREMQAVAIADYVERNADPEGFPPLLVGDFDAPPQASSVRFLSGLQSLHGRSTHFVDAWLAPGTNPESGGCTWCCENSLIKTISLANHAERNHRRRIDYIFLGSPMLYKKWAQVEECRVVLDQPSAEGAWASGHFGVFCEIATEPEGATAVAAAAARL
jgi:endonuclease/exonuclease/phosphatase family metal-dependent hydrolase